jgi:hypothetical protein
MTEKIVYTAEERAAFRAKRDEFRSEIKALSDIQSSEKKLLRMNHENILPETVKTKYGEFIRRGQERASYLQNVCYFRAKKITKLLILYREFLGKSSEMHKGKAQN